MPPQIFDADQDMPSVTIRSQTNIGKGRAHPFLERLSSLSHSGGGWGYGPNQPPHPEPTCLALLALYLELESFADAIRGGWTFLDRCQASDGSYVAPGTREEAFWPTALVLFTQSALGSGPGEVRLLTSRLLGQYSRIPRDPSKTGLSDINLTLPGWTWVSDDYAWVEPTAWACLALRRVGQGAHERVVQGQDLLLDRMLEEGGSNHAGRRIFGQPARPLAEPTALTLLALQGRGQDPKVQSAGRYLIQNSETSRDLRDLAWTKLALDAYRGQDQSGGSPSGFDYVPEALAARIESAYQARAETYWCAPSPVCEALAALALSSEQKNYFRMAETEVNQTHVDAAPPPPLSVLARASSIVPAYHRRGNDWVLPSDPASIHRPYLIDQGIRDQNRHLHGSPV